jgi:hypothetical protein
MSDTKSASQQLSDAIKALETASAQVEALKKQTRDEDLATVKRLCETHSFTQTDLRGSLKTKTAQRTPRKSTSRRKTK